MNKQTATPPTSIMISLDEYLQLFEGQSTGEPAGKSNKKVSGKPVRVTSTMKKVSYYCRMNNKLFLFILLLIVGRGCSKTMATTTPTAAGTNVVNQQNNSRWFNTSKRSAIYHVCHVLVRDTTGVSSHSDRVRDSTWNGVIVWYVFVTNHTGGVDCTSRGCEGEGEIELSLSRFHPG